MVDEIFTHWKTSCIIDVVAVIVVIAVYWFFWCFFLNIVLFWWFNVFVAPQELIPK